MALSAQQFPATKGPDELMIKYLIDASVALEFYRPKPSFSTEQAYIHSRNLRRFLTMQKENEKAIFFIPSFCIAEVRNTLARWLHREKNIFRSQEHYKAVFHTFISHVHDRKFFYSHDLNRYHNLNTTEVTEVEHTTETEFDATGLPIGTDVRTINAKLQEKDPYDHVGKYYLSTFDILIIAMGMELKKTHGEEIHLLTRDKRLYLICSKKPNVFPKSYYWDRMRISDLPKA